GSKSRNKVSVGEPAEGSLQRIHVPNSRTVPNEVKHLWMKLDCLLSADGVRWHSLVNWKAFGRQSWTLRLRLLRCGLPVSLIYPY
uniref:hypothetical protein n=1 Tax=Cronobacter dublinensis TaxID=413497 RepID=UPI001F3A37CD